jgi:predicted patatin/cPLA2 family phospholipase
MEQVLANVLARAQRASSSSGITTGLVVQGGGMRGTYSIGALKSLEEHGLRDAFDVVIGSSAGAINACYFVAGQADDAIKGYCIDLSGKRFINPWRFWRIVDIDFLVDSVIKGTRYLDSEAVTRSIAKICIPVTRADDGTYVIKSPHPSSELYEILRATSALPILFGKSVGLDDGKRYVDGGVVDSVPFLKAVELGCTDIVVVITSPLSRRRNGMTGLGKAVMLGMATLFGYSKAIRRRLVEEDEHFNQTMAILQSEAGVYEGARFVVVHPSNLSRLVTRTTGERQRLQACVELGRSDMGRLLMSRGKTSRIYSEAAEGAS